MAGGGLRVAARWRVGGERPGQCARGRRAPPPRSPPARGSSAAPALRRQLRRSRSPPATAAPRRPRPARSPPALRAYREQGNEGRSLRRFVANRASAVAIGGRPRGVDADVHLIDVYLRPPPVGSLEVLQEARGSRRAAGGTAEEANGGVADRARSPHCAGSAERQTRAESGRAGAAARPGGAAARRGRSGRAGAAARCGRRPPAAHARVPSPALTAAEAQHPGRAPCAVPGARSRCAA
jgi:hypothetical protein